MSRRWVRGVGAAAVVALLLTAVPAQAWLGGARQGGGAETPLWTAAWQALVDLWATVSLQVTAAVDATTVVEDGAGEQPPGGDLTSRDPNESKGIGIDPDGGR